MVVNLARDIQENSVVDGEGIRAVIWAQGCLHNCKGCHNPESHDFNAGQKVKVEDVKLKLFQLKCHDGVTFSGGDPLFQAKQFAEIAKYAKSINLNVWCYTGFLFEYLLQLSAKDDHVKTLLENIDVLVDGKFELEKRSLNLHYKGSTNQRVLDVPKSLELKSAVEIEKFKGEKPLTLYLGAVKRQEGLFI